MSVKMRTLDQTVEAIREMDPETAITKTSLRRLTLEGKIPCVYVGKKRLFNLELVMRYFEDASTSRETNGANISLVSK